MKISWRVFTLIAYVPIVFFVSSYSFYVFAPMSRWVEYDRVEPIKNVFEVGEKIRFNSFRNVHHRSDLLFTDRLLCENNKGEYEPQELFSTGKNDVLPTKGIDVVNWPYGDPVYFETKCFCEHTVTLLLPFGIRKSQSLVGPVFEVKYKEG